MISAEDQAITGVRVACVACGSRVHGGTRGLAGLASTGDGALVVDHLEDVRLQLVDGDVSRGALEVAEVVREVHVPVATELGAADDLEGTEGRDDLAGFRSVETVHV